MMYRYILAIVQSIGSAIMASWVSQMAKKTCAIAGAVAMCAATGCCGTAGDLGDTHEQKRPSGELGIAIQSHRVVAASLDRLR